MITGVKETSKAHFEDRFELFQLESLFFARFANSGKAVSVRSRMSCASRTGDCHHPLFLIIFTISSQGHLKSLTKMEGIEKVILANTTGDVFRVVQDNPLQPRWCPLEVSVVC